MPWIDIGGGTHDRRRTPRLCRLRAAISAPAGLRACQSLDPGPVPGVCIGDAAGKGGAMILSFSVFREKIENGEKCQTIRKYSPGQYQRFLNCWKKRETTGRYNLFWHNPRNGGTRIKDAIPSDIPFIIQFCQHESFVGKDNRFRYVIDSIINTETGESIPSYTLAQMDGFDDSIQMWDWFEKEHGKEMYQSKFMVIRWLP